MTQSKRGQVDDLSEQHVPMQLKLKILMMMMLMMMKLIIGLLMPLNHLIKIKQSNVPQYKPKDSTVVKSETPVATLDQMKSLIAWSQKRL